MKKLILAAMLGAATLQPAVSQAVSQGTNFDVTINLTSACQFSNLSAVTFNYTSFQGAVANSGGGTFDVACPAGLNYTFGLIVGPGGVGAGAATISPTTLGLNYTLNAPAGGAGTGAAVTHTISGTMGAGQAGSCAAASCNTTVQHTLVVNF